MDVTPTELPEVLLIQPRIHEDPRGFFLETWNAARYAPHLGDVAFVQDNHSRSVGRTLRGLHLQVERPQGKLVRVVRGEIHDVVVDVRLGSPRFGRHTSLHLTAARKNQVWVPPGFAHGFCVLGGDAEVEYKCSGYYDPGSELTILWNDPELAIPWPLEQPLLSDKDRAGLALADARARLPRYAG